MALKLLLEGRCKGGEYLWLVSSAVQVSGSDLCPKKFLARENLRAREQRRFVPMSVPVFQRALAASPPPRRAGHRACLSIAKEGPNTDWNASALLGDVTQNHEFVIQCGKRF